MGSNPCENNQVSYREWYLMLLRKETYVDFILPIIRKEFLSRKDYGLFRKIFLITFGTVTVLIYSLQISLAGGRRFLSLQGLDEIVITFLFASFLGIYTVIALHVSEIISGLLTNPLSPISNLKSTLAFLIFISLFTFIIGLPLDYFCALISNNYHVFKTGCGSGFHGGFTEDMFERNERIIAERLSEIGIPDMLNDRENPQLNDESIFLLRLILVHYTELTDLRLRTDQLTRFIIKGMNDDQDRYLPIPRYLDEGFIIGKRIDTKRKHDLRINGTELISSIPLDLYRADKNGIQNYLLKSQLKGSIDILSKHLAGIIGRFYLGSGDENQHREMRKVIDGIWVEAFCKLIRGNVKLFQLHTFAINHPNEIDNYLNDDTLRCDHDTGSYRFSAWRKYNLNNLKEDDLRGFINGPGIGIVSGNDPHRHLRDLYDYHRSKNYVDTKDWKNRDPNDPETVEKVMRDRFGKDPVTITDGNHALNNCSGSMDGRVCLDLPTLRLRDKYHSEEIDPIDVGNLVYMVSMGNDDTECAR